MPTTDSIVRPSLLLKSTLAAGKKANVDSEGKAGQKTDSSILLRPKKQKKFQLTDFKFAEEGYFKGNKFFKLERGNNHADGVSGVLAPYAISNDNVIAAMLLGCFVMAMVAFSLSRNFIERQIKSFFRVSRSKESAIETNEEMRFQTILIAQTSLLGSILYYLFARDLGGGRLSNDTQLGAIGCFFGVFVAYFLFKYLVYGFVNWVFFDRKNNGRWRRTQVFLSSLEGVLLFPIVLLLVYFSLSLHAALIYTLIVMLCVKMLAFYKSYSIFFKRMGASLQIILYFCALELMPLMVLWGVLFITDNYLIINF